MSQHADLTADRWSQFTRTEQLLQIAVEMHRSNYYVSKGNMEGLRLGYERVLRLTDLTVQTQSSSSLRRELLRWRDVVAELYLRDVPDAETHELALLVLLQLDPGAAQQIPYLCAS